jgi:hypothetical protein
MIVYAYLDAAGAARQAPDGLDFATVIQRIDSAEESVAALGSPIGSYVACEVQHRFRDLAGYDDQLLARWAIQRVEVADPEPGQVRAGFTLAAADGVISAEVTTVSISPQDLAALRAAKVAEIDAEAERRTLAIMGRRRQLRTIAMGMAAITQHGADASAWPDDLKAAYATAVAAWAAISAIEDAADALEASVPNDAAGIAAVVVADNPAWPA